MGDQFLSLLRGRIGAGRGCEGGKVDDGDARGGGHFFVLLFFSLGKNFKKILKKEWGFFGVVKGSLLRLDGENENRKLYI